MRVSVLIVAALVQIFQVTLGSRLKFGILVVRRKGQPDRNFCVGAYPSLHNFTAVRDDINYRPLSDLAYVSAQVDTCQPELGVQVSDKYVLVNGTNGDNSTSGNCTIQTRAENIQLNNGTGVLLNTSLALSRFNISHPSQDVTIPVSAFIKHPDAMGKLRQLAQEEGEEGEFGIWVPDDPIFDASVVVTLLIACLTVALGSLWSGYVKHHLRLKLQEQSEALPRHRRARTDSSDGEDETGSNHGSGLDGGADRDAGGRRGRSGRTDAVPDDPVAAAAMAEGRRGRRDSVSPHPRPDDEEQIYDPRRESESSQGRHPAEDISLRISPTWVIFYVILMCAMLVLLYFFMDYLVYFIIGMFCLTSTIAVYSCLEPLVMLSYAYLPCPTIKFPTCNLYICILNLELRQFVLLLGSVSISLVWLVYRNAGWAWVLQDFLAILFCINMLKVLRLPSLKICTLLLSTLFFYDIFFVFITPLITKSGKSIMVDVATGGDSGEQVPLVIKVPLLNVPLGMEVCDINFSMLGFGDVLVPGLLLSYCHSFDLHTGTPCKLYWIITNLAYVLGLVATYISLYLMESAQPALLYLVPFTLTPVILVAWIRGDLPAMWQGDFPSQQEDEADEEDLGVGKGATLPVTVDEAEEEAQKRALKTSRSSSSGQDQEAVTNQPLRRKSSGSSNPQ